MRMQSGTIPIVTLAALVAGCSDLTAGRTNPPSGPPRLVKVLVQDATFAGGPPAERAAAVDLIDDAPPVACNDIAPCANQYLIAQTTPPLACQADGFCIDPLKLPATGVPLNGGATVIRFVFNKILDGTKIETVTQDANGAPTGKAPYKLADGLFEFLGPDGQPVDGTAGFWDNTGAFDFTSDIILLPFGPALVVEPGSLNPSTSYTLRLHPSKLVDKSGQALVDKNGGALADPTDFHFTTEAIVANDAGDYPAFAGKPPYSILPNEVVQLLSWAVLDETSVVVTATGPAGFDPTKIEVYADRGGKPTKANCAKNENDSQLDFVYTSAPGVAVDWPAGSYTLSYTAKDASGTASFTSTSYAFTVAGTDGDAMDANARANHVLPEQCK